MEMVESTAGASSDDGSEHMGALALYMAAMANSLAQYCVNCILLRIGPPRATAIMLWTTSLLLML
jgi:hypothetical protein